MLLSAPVPNIKEIYIYKYTHTSPLRDPDDHTKALHPCVTQLLLLLSLALSQ